MCHILCIFQKAHRAQALMLWRKGLWLWRLRPGCGAALGAMLPQPQGGDCAEILLDLLTHEQEAGNCDSFSHLDTP